MLRKIYHVVLFVLIGLCVLCNTSFGAEVTSLPRIEAKHFEYLGAFALPSGTYGDSRFGYSGRAVTPYQDPVSGKSTLFLEGHSWNPGTVAQVEIPSELVKSDNYAEIPKANVLQNFFDIADGKWDSTGQTAYQAIFGMLPYNNRLIVAATSWYDASCSQTATHGISGFDLSLSNDFQGFYAFDAVADPRSLGGYMTLIPQAWQSYFGGPALTGNAALSIISCISSGPAATVFDPDEIGAQSPVPGSTVVYYPTSNYLVSGGVSTENTFTFGSSVKGIAFPAGSRSVLFMGVQSLADGYCYGPGTNDPDLHGVPTDGGTWCYDMCGHSKGGHGFPYAHYVWAYDANDLLKVKSGELAPWDVKPYNSWRLFEMDAGDCAGMRSAGYDSVTRRLYITQDFGEEPRVEVYHIQRPSIDSVIPAAPTELSVE